MTAVLLSGTTPELDSTSSSATTVVSVKEAAAALSRLTGIVDVAPVDLRELAARGLIRVAVPGWPPTGNLYDLADLTEAARQTSVVVELRRVGTARRAWRAASVDRVDAAALLHMRLDMFDALAARAGIQPGRFGRYDRTAVLRLKRC